MLRERWITPWNLSTEIDEAMQQLPTQLSESIDAIRNIGNFASHPTKSTQTWEIIEVEPWETEWLLDTLEDLFDYYYVAPAKTKAKKNALNKKLADAWKPPAK